MFVKASQELPELFTDIIKDELNIKKVAFTEDVSSFTDYTFKPQLRTVGPKYGKFLKQIQQALGELNGNLAMAELKSKGSITLDSVNADVVLCEEDLLITMTQQEGYVTEGDNEVTVVLDTSLTPELIAEGFVRELISKIQTMRKKAGFEVMDKIHVFYQAEETIDKIFREFGGQIQSEVLAVDITGAEIKGHSETWDINGESVVLGVEKV